MKNFIYTFYFWMGILLLSGAGCDRSLEHNWTHFRGNNLGGISENKNSPVHWNSDSNIVWKTEIHGKGWSSPVVYDNQVWVTTATEDGKELSAVCVDYKTGKIIYDILLFKPDSIFRKHSINTFATPTPCIEKDHAFAHFGRYGTAGIRTADGSVMWQRNDLQCDHIQGPGSSPLLYKDLLILHFDGTDIRYIVALDKLTGETVWQTERQQEPYEPLSWIAKKAYITPLIVQVEGRDLIVSNGSAMCSAYDPGTGEEVWWLVKGAESTIAMPFYENGLVFYYTGYMTTDEGHQYSELVAADPRGQGDITGSNIKWIMKTPILQLLTPVVKNGLIYTIDNESTLQCIDSKSGDIIYSEKLDGKYYASPVYADGKIYFFSTKGEILVINEGSKLQIITRNKLEGQIWATPAFIRDNILIRTSEYLYRIGGE